MTHRNEAFIHALVECRERPHPEVKAVKQEAVKRSERVDITLKILHQIYLQQNSHSAKINLSTIA